MRLFDVGLQGTWIKAKTAPFSPALADVVRREQDAKNEIAGLRRYLSGEAGASASPLPEVAAQMRTRIATLEAERIKYQQEIKAKFPDYENGNDWVRDNLHFGLWISHHFVAWLQNSLTQDEKPFLCFC